AIDEIHRRVGSVIRVSRVYQSNAFGFDGDYFYNIVAVVHTYLNPEEVLHLIMQIERDLGRIRSENIRYTSRTIDIDIIFFGQVSIDSPELQIPHPRFHERAFVLKPLLDVLRDYDDIVLLKQVE
ncbi:2-amino-4-hydroxy-6-hydroxymethyldihydropteridine diphosphokinase, partial [Arthrospira platensis SPKY1]|nr:2-amino-4-hydroxy-6-hydroxymethyldihydropteridine diphosphokinase [Arthrospira platensis SPKY1]